MFCTATVKPERRWRGVARDLREQEMKIDFFYAGVRKKPADTAAAVGTFLITEFEREFDSGMQTSRRNLFSEASAAIVLSVWIPGCTPEQREHMG